MTHPATCTVDGNSPEKYVVIKGLQFTLRQKVFLPQPTPAVLQNVLRFLQLQGTKAAGAAFLVIQGTNAVCRIALQYVELLLPYFDGSALQCMYKYNVQGFESQLSGKTFILSQTTEPGVRSSTSGRCISFFVTVTFFFAVSSLRRNE